MIKYYVAIYFRVVIVVLVSSTIKEMARTVLLTMHANSDFTIVAAMTGVSIEAMENLVVK